MERSGVLDFKVGQLAEMRTFEHGYRGAWFRCKIKDILLEKNKILLEYYDYDLLEVHWEKIYQVPHYARKSKPIQRLLMVRPQYPNTYYKNEMPPINSVSQVGVVTDGAWSWKVGDLVDWFQDGCFWSAWVVKVLSNDKVQIALPMPPLGEGEKGRHEAFSEDLRPSLEWSELEGWTFRTVIKLPMPPLEEGIEGEKGRHEAFSMDLRPSLEWLETESLTFSTADGQSSCDAHLIFPTKQDMDLEVDDAAAASSRVYASSATFISSREKERATL